MSTKMTQEQASAYWRRNLSLMVRLLGRVVCGQLRLRHLFVDALNQIQIGGYKLGFWFAQQGSIYVFVVLIFYYTRKMGQLDREFGVEEE
jgi:putative solute:sodium symporter small subunit